MTSVLQQSADYSPDLANLVDEIARLEAVIRRQDAQARGTAEAYGRAIEAINGEALRRLVRVLSVEPTALAALKDAVGDEVIYAVLRRHGIIKPSLTERVEAALASVRPMLVGHGGDVELVEVIPPVVSIRLLGSCDGCAASALTFYAGVRKAVLAECPEISEIAQVKGRGASNSVHRSPFSTSGDANWHFIGNVADIPEAGLLATCAGEQPLLLTRRGRAIACFRNSCAHMGHTLGTTSMVDGTITCAHHGFRYDGVSGECFTAPGLRLHAFDVRIVDDHVEVRMAE